MGMIGDKVSLDKKESQIKEGAMVLKVRLPGWYLEASIACD